MDLHNIYKILYNEYGKQNWWPAETFDEIIIGAILTQNTNWLNVEKAIKNIKDRDLCTLENIATIEGDSLATLIRPSGYFNQKAKRLIEASNRLDVELIKAQDLWSARKSLLSINGIGPETADSILLYAFEKPIFVIDAYTMRVFTRLGVVLYKYNYDSFQKYFMNNLVNDVRLFNEYHALIVRHCKISCMKKPLCDKCCLKSECKYGEAGAEDSSPTGPSEIGTAI